MGAITWGILGPDTLSSQRRTRTLQLGATVRAFNDLAVPGMGGVWFGKQLFLATLGVCIAERVRQAGKQVTNIETANAIEALGCWLALDDNGWHRDPRVRGATKMRRDNRLDFAYVRRPRFYVTQPMRQATIQPLRSLGLVESSGERFNGFSITNVGREFIEDVCGGVQSFSMKVEKRLVSWASGVDDRVKSSPLRKALSPIEVMPIDGRRFLRERLVASDDTDASRRKNALAWVDSCRANPYLPIHWNDKPTMIDDEHWRNLHAGARFFLARDAAITLLDKIEELIGSRTVKKLSLTEPLPTAIVDHCEELLAIASEFLADGCDPSPQDGATVFCQQCVVDSPAIAIRHLLAREGRVLQLNGDEIVPGSAFRGVPADEAPEIVSDEDGGTETPPPETVSWPPGISQRVRNLFLLNLDLRGELGNRLKPNDESEAQTS